MKKIGKPFPLIVLLSVAAFLFSCKKESAQNTPVAARMFGTVQTWDDKTTSTSDMAGIKVTITNLANVSTTTDATGRYSFENVAFDLYDLEFSKTGYGTFKLYGVTHAYNASTNYTQLPLVGFGKLSTTTVTSLTVSGNTIGGEPGVTFDYGLSPAPSTASRAFVRYFLGTTAGVSSTSYSAFTGLLNFSNLSNITGFSKSQLLGYGFTSGQTVYVRMYGDSFRSNEYTDPNTGKTIFPNINTTTAPAVSFVVP